MNRHFFTRRMPLAAAAFCMLSMPFAFAADEASTSKRLSEAAVILHESMGTPDKGIPQDLIDHAKCMVVVPNLKKAGFIVGAKYGKGFLTCRNGGGWSTPAAVRIEGGSVGFQIGASDSDVILLVRNDKGMEKLLQSKFTIGGEGEIAAGPVGRDAQAQTDAQMTAEILSWSRTRGVFAGISLTGATLREDMDDNVAMYGSKVSNRAIVTGHMKMPEGGDALIKALDRKSPMKMKD